MNIFWLDEDPKVMASYHHDIHCQKMLLEMAQMLSTTIQMNGVPNAMTYKMTHQNHPCAKWVRYSRPNLERALRVLWCLHAEFCYRYRGQPDPLLGGRPDAAYHLSYKKMLTQDFDSIVFSHDEATQPPVCIKNTAHHRPTLIESYREYYRQEKLVNEDGHVNTWSGRSRPYWI